MNEIPFQTVKSRPTDHRNLDLAKLHRDVIRGTSNGMVIWQPRIDCWYWDRLYRKEPFPAPYTGLDINGIYRELGCSNRLYNQFNDCFTKVHDPRVRRSSIKLSELETEYTMETPAGKVSQIIRSNDSNGGSFPQKWWVTSEEDLKVMMWIEERCTWAWNQEHYDNQLAECGDLGLPTIFMPRVNVQNLFIDLMGVEEAIYAIYDYPETVEAYFKVLSESHERLIGVINSSPIDVINFGDNVHAGMLPPELFKKYALPEYQKRNELLHKANKFTHSHWDGDTKSLLPYARECGFDGIEAVTPDPQGDVTLQEVKKAFGDDLFLIDGIAALLFEDSYPLEQLERQVKEALELFAPRLILGISDEISSLGNLDRIKFVGDIIDDYNEAAKCRLPR
jgi:hypothetical protein